MSTEGSPVAAPPAVAVDEAPTTAPTSSIEESPAVPEVSKAAQIAVAPPDEASPQNGKGPPVRVKLTLEQIEAATKKELTSHWLEQDTYLDTVECQCLNLDKEVVALREHVERLKMQHAESQHREKVLVRRLASKEQEMQDYASQLAELRASQVPSAAALRSALLDPAASLLVQKLRHELAATKTRLEETQNELSAWKFTPDSNTGKRLMAKCRLLYQENEELGRVIASGRLAKLEGELALQKSFSDEVKKSQSELDEFLQELDEDEEGMQGTIYFLQQQLQSAKETVTALTQENSKLRQVTGTEQQEEEKECQEEWERDEETTRDSSTEPAACDSAQTTHQEDKKQTETEQSIDEENEVEETSCDPEPEEPPNKRTRLSSPEEDE